MLREQGWSVDHTSVFRWVQRYGPELAKRCRAFLKPTNRSYRTDETFHEMPGPCQAVFSCAGTTLARLRHFLSSSLLPILCFVCLADREAFRRRRSFSVPASIRTGFLPHTFVGLCLLGFDS